MRADGGFAVPDTYHLCEKERIHYMIGFVTNSRLKAKTEDLLVLGMRQFEQAEEK